MSVPPVDPALAVAALLQKLDDVDKATFNWLVAAAKAEGAREALELLADWADHAPILLTSVAVAVEARARIARPVHAAEDCALPGEPPR